ncbi:MAG TPA: Rieske 2Fe-2S domain-containing protein [Microbacteriaceae bacterium]|nr:Rieske 2Fe-2S domain-containing protein [Microbacteriaceae bacterium]
MSVPGAIVRFAETRESLDKLNDLASGWVKRLTRRRAVKNLLSGTGLGHPLHPLLTDVPIGAWTMASMLDLTAGRRGADAARRLVGVGVLGAVPTIASGAADWSDTYGPEQRLGHVHAIANIVGTLLQTGSWLARRRGRRGTGVLLSLTGIGVTAAAGYLGGALSFGRGVGVNHTAFEEAPEGWVDVAADADLQQDRPLRVDAAGTPVMLVRHRERIRALSATCVHAGGPLDEGEIVGDAVRCPWHGSEFRLADGQPTRGPAAISQPVWNVKVEAGRVLVRPRA